ncbi:MAG: hypothetical protein M1435_01995 [Actinobacteria bacterium]|nr:hypothetical protein [Actinomycetota bacterium]
MAPTVPGHEPRAVVYEREQDGLLAPDDRAVERVAGPKLVRVAGFEAPEGDVGAREGGPRQALGLEVTLQGAGVGREALGGTEHLCYVGGAPRWALPPELGGHFEGLFRAAGLDPARPRS